MDECYDENFEVDAPKYVDFTVPQDLYLQDNADEWFNFDHENGIPVNFEGNSSSESSEKMDVSSPDSGVEESSRKANTAATTPVPTQSQVDEVYATPMAVTKPTDTRLESSPTIVAPPVLRQEEVKPEEERDSSTAPTTPQQPPSAIPNIILDVASSESPAPPLQETATMPLTVVPSEEVASDSPTPPLQKTATMPLTVVPPVASDSPAPPLQQQTAVPSTIASDVAMNSPALQDNLELISLSAENTPKENKASATEPTTIAPAPVRPSNIVTSLEAWKDRSEDKAVSRPSRQTTRTPVKKKSRSLTRSNSVRRSTRRSVVKTKPSPAKKSTALLGDQHKRRSAPQNSAIPKKRPSVENGAIPKKRPSVETAGHKRRLVRRSAVVPTTTRASSVESTTRTTRASSVESSSRTTRASSAESTTRKRRSSPHVLTTPSAAGKRKRPSEIPNPRKSPRLQQKPTLTMPQTPNCLRRNFTAAKPGQKFKSSEELELERIQKAKAEARKVKAASKKSYAMAQEPMTYHPTRSVQEPTRPVGFKFETDSRLKSHGMETRQDRDNKDFMGNLRKHPRSPAKPKATKQKPFHFSSGSDGSRKRRTEDADPAGVVSAKYKPMALQIQEFHRKTPDRFRTKVANDIAAKGQPMKAVHTATRPPPTLTCPKTPNLSTKTRSRPNTAVSAAEKEEMEVQEMKNFQFHAQPVDPRVMSNLHLGLQKPMHKSPTRFVEFNLECEKRFQEREANKSDEEEERHEFHAQEVNPRMLEGPLGIAEAKPLPLTVPQSPAFALKNRVRTIHTASAPEEKETSRIMRANPIPHSGVPFRPDLKHKTTEPTPFSFDRRDQETNARKEAKISKMIEEEQQVGQFKAQPLPDHNLIKLPEKKMRPVTRPQPFRSVEEHAAKQAEMWGKKMEEELKEQREQANSFRAKPADVLYEAPYVPKKSNKALTEVSDFELNTDRRVEDRRGFEEHKHALEAELRVASEERKRMEEEEERQAVQRLRQEMVHKANPIRNFQPVDVLPSQQPLTTPESPQFATDARLRGQPRV